MQAAMLWCVVAPPTLPAPPRGPIPPRVRPGQRSCRVCGCTNNMAGPGGCHWVEFDLCSACDGPRKAAKWPRAVK
jgi:hypothetical protein